MKVSVLTIAWKRFADFNLILENWLSEKEVDQVIVWDNSGQFKTSLPNVLVLSLNKNLNSKWRFICSQLCKNDLIILADDDFIPKQGITEDLLKHYDEDRLVGIKGRRLIGDTYYTSPTVGSDSISQSIKVDYLCSNILLTHRKHCVGVDVREIPTSLMDDWWWEHELAQKGITFWVVPTNKWVSILEQEYEFAQHLDPVMKEIREYYFKKWIKNENPEIPLSLRDKARLT